MAKTDTQERGERSARMEDAFKVAEEMPTAHLPAISQVVLDDRPTGALDVKVKRDLKRIMQDIKTIAAAAGTDFYYSWATRNKDGTKGIVEGPSVKCANAVSRIYGNCMVRVRPQDTPTHWILHAQFVDLESGYVYERPFQQRKNQNVGGKMDADRAADMVFQIGVSKAARNVVCNALSEFTDYAVDIAKEKMVETIGKKIDAYKEKVLERLAEIQVDLKRVEAIRGKAIATWTAYDVAKTIAEIQTVNDGMAQADDIWPPLDFGTDRPQPEDFQEAKTDETKQTDKTPPAADTKAESVKATERSPAGDKPVPAAATEAKGPVADNGTPAAAGPDADQKPQEGQAGTGVVISGAVEQKLKGPKQAATGAQTDEQAETLPEETAPESEAATEPEPADGSADLAAVAFEKAENWLAEQIRYFQDFTGKEGAERLELIKAQLQQQLRDGWPDLDPEDRSVLGGRLNTSYLEKKRHLTRRK